MVTLDDVGQLMQQRNVQQFYGRPWKQQLVEWLKQDEAKHRRRGVTVELKMMWRVLQEGVK